MRERGGEDGESERGGRERNRQTDRQRGRQTDGSQNVIL